MDGEDPGWVWSNLHCEPGVEIENWALDNRPEGNERCVCTLADPAYGRDINQVLDLMFHLLHYMLFDSRESSDSSPVLLVC